MCTILHYIIISHSLFNIKYGAYASGTISDLFNAERSEQVSSGNATQVTAPIGFIYPSDYMYATDGNCRGETNCYENWILRSGGNEHTITHNSINNYLYYVVQNNGITGSAAYGGSLVRPALYLKSNVGKLAGNGTRENPYIIDMIS